MHRPLRNILQAVAGIAVLAAITAPLSAASVNGATLSSQAFDYTDTYMRYGNAYHTREYGELAELPYGVVAKLSEDKFGRSLIQTQTTPVFDGDIAFIFDYEYGQKLDYPTNDLLIAYDVSNSKILWQKKLSLLIPGNEQPSDYQQNPGGPAVIPDQGLVAVPFGGFMFFFDEKTGLLNSTQRAYVQDKTPPDRRFFGDAPTVFNYGGVDYVTVANANGDLFGWKISNRNVDRINWGNYGTIDSITLSPSPGDNRIHPDLSSPHYRHFGGWIASEQTLLPDINNNNHPILVIPSQDTGVAENKGHIYTIDLVTGQVYGWYQTNGGSIPAAPNSVSNSYTSNTHQVTAIDYNLNIYQISPGNYNQKPPSSSWVWSSQPLASKYPSGTTWYGLADSAQRPNWVYAVVGNTEGKNWDTESGQGAVLAINTGRHRLGDIVTERKGQIIGDPAVISAAENSASTFLKQDVVFAPVLGNDGSSYLCAYSVDPASSSDTTYYPWLAAGNSHATDGGGCYRFQGAFHMFSSPAIGGSQRWITMAATDGIYFFGPTQPDLAITKVSYASQTVDYSGTNRTQQLPAAIPTEMADTPQHLDITITNTGTQPVRWSDLSPGLHMTITQDNQTIVSDLAPPTRLDGDWKAKQSITVSLPMPPAQLSATDTLAWENGVTPGKQGDHTITITIDDGSTPSISNDCVEAISETNELYLPESSQCVLNEASNNRAVLDYTVADLPNLVIGFSSPAPGSTYYIDPEQGSPPTAVPVTMTIGNNGKGDVKPDQNFVVELLKDGQAYQAWSVTGGLKSVENLQISLTIWESEVAQHTLVAIVDYTNTVRESNEADNVAQTTYITTTSAKYQPPPKDNCPSNNGSGPPPFSANNDPGGSYTCTHYKVTQDHKIVPVLIK